MFLIKRKELEDYLLNKVLDHKDSQTGKGTGEMMTATEAFTAIFLSFLLIGIGYAIRYAVEQDDE